jgi:hypothetical protein
VARFQRIYRNWMKSKVDGAGSMTVKHRHQIFAHLLLRLKIKSKSQRYIVTSLKYNEIRCKKSLLYCGNETLKQSDICSANSPLPANFLPSRHHSDVL